MIRIAFIAAVLLSLGACHSIPDPNDPGRQKRIDDCLKQCGGGASGRENNAYPPASSEQADSRTPCERRCHGIP